MLKANDYGKILTLESCRKIKIDDLVRRARQEAKRLYIQSLGLESGHRIDLVTSDTRYGGKRYWFICPRCSRRIGNLYQQVNTLSCRICTGLSYRSSRYKGMLESDKITLRL